MYYLYILECSDNSLYTGITNDFSKRIQMHNNGKASKYTRSRLPVKYVFIKKVDNKSDALKLEIKTKKLTRDKKLKLITSNENEIDNILKKA